MLETLAIQAFLFGLLSAASLPIGAAIGLVWSPKQKIEAAMTAFGSGALIAPLSIDLLGEALKRGDFFTFAFGCIVGGSLFFFFNKIVNNKGGFLRSAANTINHLRRKKTEYYKHVFEKLSQVHLFNELPPEEIQSLLPYVSSRTYEKGQRILRQGDPGDSLFIIEEGEVDIVDEKNNSRKIATLLTNDVLGEIALITGETRTATAVAVSDTRVWIILKEHFDKLMQNSPKVAEAVRQLVNTRLDDLRVKKTIDHDKAEEWANKAARNIDAKITMPTDMEIKEAASKESNAPIAIWFGNILDNIPEAIVVGANLLHASVSFALLAGLFISNFPQALSSSLGMQQQNYTKGKVLWMWTSLMLITGVGAYFGNIFFVGVPGTFFSFAEGMASGAILTVIAETMLPEAYYKGGDITGISTLLGFLAAIFFKTLE